MRDSRTKLKKGARIVLEIELLESAIMYNVHRLRTFHIFNEWQYLGNKKSYQGPYISNSRYLSLTQPTTWIWLLKERCCSSSIRCQLICNLPLYIQFQIVLSKGEMKAKSYLINTGVCTSS